MHTYFMVGEVMSVSNVILKGTGVHSLAHDNHSV